MKVKGNLLVSGDLRGINVTDDASTFTHVPKIIFDGAGFYLQGNSQGNPRVILRTQASTITITDGVNSFNLSNKLSFNGSNFYLSNGGGGGQPEVNLRNGILKSLSLEFPGAAENTLIFYAPRAMTLLSARAVLVGSATPSVTFSVKSGTDRSSLGVTHTTSTAVTSTTTGTLLGVSTASIPAGSWVCLVSTAQSGTVSELDVHLEVEFV